MDAEDAWNTRDPPRVAAAYTADSQWRNRSEFVRGRAEIVAFLTRKWHRRAGLRAAQRTCGRSPPTGSPCGSSTSGTTTPSAVGRLRRVGVRPHVDEPIAVRRASTEETALDLGLRRHRRPDADLDAVPFALRHPAEDRHDQIVGFALRDSLFGARNRSRAARNSSNVAVAPSVGLHRGPACARTPSSWPVTVVAAMSVDLARRHRQFREITRREPARHRRTHGNHAASAAAVG